MNHPITKTLLALGCAGTFAATASAQLPTTTYSTGDFLLGFREAGNSNSVVVDIGPITSFTTPSVYTIDAGSTLSAQYGSGWENNSAVFFSLSSTDSSGDLTNYVTSAQYLTGPNAGPAKVWGRLTTTNSRILSNKINAFGSEFTSTGEVEPASDPNAYENYMPGGTKDSGHAGPANIAYGFFNPTIEGNFSQSTTGVVLDLIELVPGSGPGTNLGDFSLDPTGTTLTFTPEVVPEPSSFAAMAMFGALAFFGFRMNKTRKSSTKEQFA